MLGLSLGTGVGGRGPGRAAPQGPAAPALVAPPRILGSGRIGAPLAADPGTWSGAPAPVLHLQWQRDGQDLPGATAPSFLPQPADDLAALRLRVTAANASGTTGAYSPNILISFDPPRLSAPLPDVAFPLDTGVHILDASSVFTGSSLTFGVTGEGVTIDPETGLVSIATDSLASGVTVTVTALNSGGAATGTFTLTVTAAAAEPGAIAPGVVEAPALLGAARIGESVLADPGIWSGTPVPALALQWLRDGEEIAGATGLAYVPVEADDGRGLAVRVTATNVAGTAAAETAPVIAAHAPPTLAAPLADLVLVLGSGPYTVDAAAAFAGAALGYAVAGAGAAIDAATGLLTLATEAPLAGETVTVTATNSGGSAAVAFRLDVAAADEPVPDPVPPALAAAPRLAGAAKIGLETLVEPGLWEGDPVPDLTFRWLIDGEEIAGATGEDYVPVPADDGRALSCRVVATNAAGEAETVTDALEVSHVAPVAAGGLEDVVLARGDTLEIPAAGAFEGAALVFSVEGTGAAIDPVTGVLVLVGAAAGSTAVTVTATNSGGAASAGFMLVVAAEQPGEPEPGIAAPVADGTIADLVLDAGSGPATVSAQAGFLGEALVFTLEAAPAGVTINPGSGLVTIPADAPLAETAVTVRAANAAGSAVQTFRLAVRATRSAFDAAPALGDIAWAHTGAQAPLWTGDAAGFCRLQIQTGNGRAHGDWIHARGDGLYRTLARWTGPGGSWRNPFSFTGRLRRVGDNWSGICIEAATDGAGARDLRIRPYTGSGTARIDAAVAPFAWDWGVWYWVETLFDGPRVRARLYPENAAAPDWQIEFAEAAVGEGAFGPGSAPGAGWSGTSLDIRRIEWSPVPQVSAGPPAARDGDWKIEQIRVQA